MSSYMDSVDPKMRELHALWSKNKEAITKSHLAGCFFCCTMYEATAVVEYAVEHDKTETAICPICGVDSVIGDASTTLNKEMLQSMCSTWF